MAKDAYYFKHDSNTRNDPKIIKLRRLMGREASDVFFDLVCLLREQVNYRLMVASLPDIAYDFRYPEAKLTKIVKDFDLFTIEGDHFYSERLIADMEEWDRQKQSYRDRGKKGGEAKAKHSASTAKAQPEQKDGFALPLNKVNKVNKEEESKEEQTGTVVPVAHPPSISEKRPDHAPTWEAVCEAFVRLGKPDQAKGFFDYYEGFNWMVRDTKIMNVAPFANRWVSNAIAQKEQQASADGLSETDRQLLNLMS
jgi:hypothetical protein